MQIVFEPMKHNSKLLVTKFVFTKQENRELLARRYGTYEPFIKKVSPPQPKVTKVPRVVRPMTERRVVEEEVSAGKIITVAGYVFLASGCFLFLLAGGFGMSAGPWPWLRRCSDIRWLGSQFSDPASP